VDSLGPGLIARDRAGAPASGRGAAGILVLVLALGGALRFWAISRAPPNPFYDAAVRSMGLSWHNFFFGALEPGGSVSIDKPPIDLWMQVVSTKLLGFTTFALHVPEAIGGTVAVALLYGAVRSVWGRRAGVLSALAMAVLPISVLTSRSDTMDSVMTALLVAALWASIRALQTRRGAWVMVAAVLVGVAFNVKLTQALVPLPAFFLIWAAAAQRRRRALVLIGSLATLLVVGMSWIVIASLTPTAERPHPIGSGTGSIYRVVFVFNGVDRVSGRGVQLGPSDPTVAGPLRLLAAGGDYARLVGVELVWAIALVLALLATRRGRVDPPEEPGTCQAAAVTSERRRVARWTAIGIGVWPVVSVVLFSVIRQLQRRYVETGSAPLAAVIGICLVVVVSRSSERVAARALGGAVLIGGAYAVAVATDWTGRIAAGGGVAVAAVGLAAAGPLRRERLPDGVRRLAGTGGLAVVVALAVFALPARVSVDLVGQGISDAATGSDGAQYGAFLTAHRQGARYEVASDATLGVVGLISADAQPVLVLNDLKGPLVRLAALEHLVGRGDVRYVLLEHPCAGGPRCPATTRWSIRHAVRIRGYLYGYEILGQTAGH
jgi:4-amino-4-deoxy-L-arabinose transferase-like glycosyltransferase